MEGLKLRLDDPETQRHCWEHLGRGRTTPFCILGKRCTPGAKHYFVDCPNKGDTQNQLRVWRAWVRRSSDEHFSIDLSRSANSVGMKVALWLELTTPLGMV